MKHFIRIVLIVFTVCNFLNTEAQVMVSTDLSSKAYKKEPVPNIWNVVNRISPKNGVSVMQGVDVNIVRMVGGILKKVNGKRVPNYEYDPCRYDSINNKYIYNWKPLLMRIHKVKRSKTKIFQLVLDQPCWAFQHGYNFTPDDQPYNGVDFKESERVSIYGNSLPPKDKEAYYTFIHDMMEVLIRAFGEEEVLSWRFRVGSEIETPDHWWGTKEDFIHHFANTEKAIRSVLKDAKIGLHTRTPDFIYKKGRVKNYKGEPFASFASGLIEYCFDNNIRYDFWGVSDYVIINNSRPINLSHKYEELFEPLTSNPKWQKGTLLDVMEYTPVVSIKGRGFLKAATIHSQIVDLAFSHMFYKKQNEGLGKIYRWGMRKKWKNTGVIAELESLIGYDRYETNITGSAHVKGNLVDALFTKINTKNFDAIVYSYNDTDLKHKKAEAVKLVINTKLPVGATLTYKKAIYSKDQNKFESFLKNEPKSGWFKPKKNRRGEPEKVLNKAGLKAWEAYKHKTPYAYSKKTEVVTVPRLDNGKGSCVVIDVNLPSFSYVKFKFRTKKNWNK